MTLNATKAKVHCGNLIALEGDPDTVATQLRLLPPSPKILILPPLDSTQSQEGIAFNAQLFVRGVHEQLQNRFKKARSFLKSSTVEQPRFVFMNGGSVNAVVKCVTAISENVTNGKIGEAEDLFHEIVKDGITGLLRQDSCRHTTGLLCTSYFPILGHQSHSGTTVYPSGPDQPSRYFCSTCSCHIFRCHPEEGVEIPTERQKGHTQIEEGNIRPNAAGDRKDEAIIQEAETYQPADHPNLSAMKAADSLDRDTASLQQSAEDELEDTEIIDIWHNAARSTTGSVPNTPRIMDIFSTNEEGNSIKTTVIEVPYSRPGERNVFSPPPYTPRTARSAFTDRTSRDGSMDNFYLRSPSLYRGISAPPTPGLVELGEACIVEVPTNCAKAVKRVKSIDYSSSCTLKSPFVGSNHHSLKRTTSENGLRYSGSKIPRNTHSQSQGFSALENVPRPTFVKASETVITRSPGTSRYLHAPHIYIDRGTDTRELYESETSVDEPEEDTRNSRPFEPIFTTDEDLIIHFNNGSKSEIFESVIRSYKNGYYPVVSRRSYNSRGFKLLSSSSRLDEINETHLSPIAVNIDSSPYYLRRNVKPNSQKDIPLGGRCARPAGEDPKDLSYNMSKAEPPTPATTPPLVESIAAQKFHEVTIPSDAITAIDVQNSLRSTLGIRFPPETTKVSQHLFAIESNRLWRPVFHSSANLGHEGTAVDQIIAIGCEDGVAKDLFHSISAQVENLGCKKHCLNRASRLDIRYLTKLAMQTFASQQLSIQGGQNPLTEPTLLAALIIPQLEIYLSSNDSAHLLILHYPASYLPTVLALRKLLGAGLIKVAGIIDSLAGDPPLASVEPLSPKPPTQPRPELSEAGSLRARKQTSSSSLNHPQVAPSIGGSSTWRDAIYRQQAHHLVSFSSADYLLPSAATEPEISIFISAIRACLVEKSPFYVQETKSCRSSTTSTSQSKRKSKSSRRPSTSSTVATAMPTVINKDENPNTTASVTAINRSAEVEFYGRQRELDRGRERERERGRGRGREREWEKEMEREREKEKEKKVREREREWEKEMEREREREKEKKVREREREKERERERKRELELQNERAWTNFYITADDEEDEEMDQLERVLMPLYRITHEPSLDLTMGHHDHGRGTTSATASAASMLGKNSAIGRDLEAIGNASNCKKTWGGKSLRPCSSRKALRWLGLA